MASPQPSPPRPRAGSLPPPMPTAVPNVAGGRGTALSGAASKSYSVVGHPSCAEFCSHVLSPPANSVIVLQLMTEQRTLRLLTAKAESRWALSKSCVLVAGARLGGGCGPQ